MWLADNTSHAAISAMPNHVVQQFPYAICGSTRRSMIIEYTCLYVPLYSPGSFLMFVQPLGSSICTWSPSDTHIGVSQSPFANLTPAGPVICDRSI